MKNREEEGIELQVLSNKPAADTLQPPGCSSIASYTEVGAVVSTDIDSLESGDFQRMEVTDGKPNSSTIGTHATLIDIN